MVALEFNAVPGNQHAITHINAGLAAIDNVVVTTTNNNNNININIKQPT